eukprot:PITA_24521
MITSLDRGKQREKRIARGPVYCDLCSAGRATLFSFFLPGARVAIQCRNSSGNDVLYTEAVTDSNGRFHENLDGCHNQQVCKAQLRSSQDASCNITTEKSISFVHGSSFEHTVALVLSPLKKPLSCAELSNLCEKQLPWFIFPCISVPPRARFPPPLRGPPPLRLSPNVRASPTLRGPPFLICATAQLPNLAPASTPVTPPYFSISPPPYFSMPPTSTVLPTASNNIPPSPKTERSSNTPPRPC